MIIRAAADQTEAVAEHAAGQGAGVEEDLLLVGLELRLEGLLETNRFRGDDMHERPALDAGEGLRINLLGMGLLAQNQPAPRTAQRLVGGGRHEIGVFHGAGVQADGDQAGNVRDVSQQISADRTGDFTHALKLMMRG